MKCKGYCSIKIFEWFLGSLAVPLINCEIELDFSWSKNCIISEIRRTRKVPAIPYTDLPNLAIAESLTIGAAFEINSAKLYVFVVTLSINDSIILLEHLKQGFRRTISWEKYRFEITTHSKKQQFRLYDRYNI